MCTFRRDSYHSINYTLLVTADHGGHGRDPGTIYPILHGMEEAGWLNREERVIAGRVR
jgi:DNA-binding PadR family transcriptional regulator